MATTAAPTEAWHYPPELVELAVKAVSLLNKGKEGELDFFRGAGVPRSMLAALEQQVAIDRNAISKAAIARRVITRLNDAGDAMIGPRREILNRIVRTTSPERALDRQSDLVLTKADPQRLAPKRGAPDSQAARRRHYSCHGERGPIELVVAPSFGRSAETSDLFAQNVEAVGASSPPNSARPSTQILAGAVRLSTSCSLGQRPLL